MITKPIHICVECEHYGDVDRTAVRCDVRCKASPFPVGVDPVSGLTLPFGASGVPEIGAFEFRLCRDVNEGGCCFFEAATAGGEHAGD